MVTSVKGHGYRCSCNDCKTYRKYGQLYEARVRREYAWALARLRMRGRARVSRDTRRQAYALAQALAHALGCQCEEARKWRQEAVQKAFDAQVAQWDLSEEEPKGKRFPWGI